MFNVGDIKSCTELQIPDLSLSLEFTGKEYKLELSLTQTDTGVTLEESQVWLTIIDNDSKKTSNDTTTTTTLYSCQAKIVYHGPANFKASQLTVTIFFLGYHP